MSVTDSIAALFARCGTAGSFKNGFRGKPQRARVAYGGGPSCLLRGSSTECDRSPTRQNGVEFPLAGLFFQTSSYGPILAIFEISMRNNARSRQCREESAMPDGQP